MAGEELTIAQPCFPVKVAHGHVQDLLEKGADYILLPNIVNAEAPDGPVDSFLCPWSQTLPFVIRAAPQLDSAQAKYLSPHPTLSLGAQARGEATGRVRAHSGR